MKKWLILTTLFFTTHAGPVHQVYPDAESERTIPVYVISTDGMLGLLLNQSISEITFHLTKKFRIADT